MEKTEKYIPAFGVNWLTPLYDPFVRLFLPEARFKTYLVRQAGIQGGHRVLDLGCGTATLTILIKKSHPDTEVIGLDGDDKVLEIARKKAAKAGAEITLHEGMAFDLPYPDSSFDRVVSSLVLHHLTAENKQRTLKEVLRVLRPHGELHVADFVRPHRSKDELDKVSGLAEIMRGAGFDEVEECAQYRTLFGKLSLYRGQRR